MHVQKHRDAFVSCLKNMTAINKKLDRSKLTVSTPPLTHP